MPPTTTNEEFVKSLYNRILCCEPDENGFRYWLNLLSQGAKKEQLENQFRQIAANDNSKNTTNNTTIKDFLINNGKKHLAFIMPQSIGDLLWISCLFKDAKDQYPNYNLYLVCQPELADILEGNEFLDKIIPYSAQFDNLIFLEGQATNPGIFDIAFLPHISSQRVLSYLHNSQDKISFNLSKE